MRTADQLQPPSCLNLVIDTKMAANSLKLSLPSLPDEFSVLSTAVLEMSSYLVMNVLNLHRLMQLKFVVISSQALMKSRLH